MPERVKQTWGRVRDFFKNMKKGMKIGLIAGGAVILALILTLVIYGKTRPYEVLFGELSSEDLTLVVSYLNSAGATDFKIRNNDTVLVRESQADRLRAAVIQQGYPTSGYGYGTYLSNISALSSQADREQLALYDLQERLGKTIRCFDGVSDADVYITPGENHRYILSEDVAEAAAGVHVTMQGNRTLSKDQVSAIQRLVASAQQGLNISNVTVEDGAGNRYSTNSAADVLDETMQNKLTLEARVNEETRNSVMAVLVPYFGADNVEVSVHSTVDVTHSYSELLQYFEPEWADRSTGGKGIIGSQIWDNSLVRPDGGIVQGGTVGEPVNSEINEYVTNEGTVRGDETEVATSGEINYNVSHETTQTERPAGTITDVTVAIAVNSAKFNLQNPAVFVHAAAMAAGIDSAVEAEKVAIVSYPFYQDSVGVGASPIEDVSMILGLPAWAVYAAIAGIALFLALLLVLLLLRSKKKQKLALLLAEEQERAAREEEERLAAEKADIMDVNTEETMKMRMDVRQFVEENPAIAAQMIKNWLRGEDGERLGS